MNLKHLTDSVLLTDTKYFASKERELTAKILWHLREIDRRKLFAAMKYSSLFAYCVKELGYSEPAAQRRIQAARMLKDIPEIEEKIESGSLNLTTIGMAGSFFKENEVDDPKVKRKILKDLENKTKKEAERLLNELVGKKPEVKISISEETMEALRELKALLGKNYSMDELVKIAVTAAKEKVEKVKFKQVPSPAKVVGVTAVKREVYKRDKVCTNCGSIFNLNFDHRHPKSHGGDFSPENIRLLCFHCNQRARIEQKMELKFKL